MPNQNVLKSMFTLKCLCDDSIIAFTFSFRKDYNPYNFRPICEFSTRFIQYIKWILPKEFAIGSTVDSWTFFKEINSDMSFEDCQHDLLY